MFQRLIFAVLMLSAALAWAQPQADRSSTSVEAGAEAPARRPAGPSCEIGSLSLNTGIDPTTGLPIPLGSPDPTWTVLSDPFPSTVEPRPADVFTNPNIAWQTIPNSQWIGSQFSSSQSTNGCYYYQSCFCLLDGFSHAQLNLALRADDQADVFLNTPLSQIKCPPTPPQAQPILHGTASSFGHPQPDTLSPPYTGPFHSGKNCLIVRVNNTNSVATGFDLTGSISAAGPHGAGGVLKPGCCQRTGSICGTKWKDSNHDGIHQTSEPGLQGWTIHLSNGQTAVTDQFGNYCFTNLPAGSYTVTEQNQIGWTQTLPKNPPSYSVALGAGTVVGGKDFGNCKGRGCNIIVGEPLCTLKAKIASSCCLGPTQQGGSNFYSFLASINLAGQVTCTLKATSSTTGLVIGTYGPTTLNAGANFVTGTFSAPPTSSPYSLSLACTNGKLALCSTTLTAPLPDCRRPQPSPDSPTSGLQ